MSFFRAQEIPGYGSKIPYGLLKGCRDYRDSFFKWPVPAPAYSLFAVITWHTGTRSDFPFIIPVIQRE
jgi:hypothetical protein